jgi:hypothetical protein
MSVGVSAVFVSSCAGTGLATGLIKRPRSLANRLQDPYFQINSDGKRPEGLIRKVENIILIRALKTN